MPRSIGPASHRRTRQLVPEPIRTDIGWRCQESRQFVDQFSFSPSIMRNGQDSPQISAFSGLVRSSLTAPSVIMPTLGGCHDPCCFHMINAEPRCNGFSLNLVKNSTGLPQLPVYQGVHQVFSTCQKPLSGRIRSRTSVVNVSS